MTSPFSELYALLAARMRDNWPDPARIKWPDRRFIEPSDKGYYVAFFVLDAEGEWISVSRVRPLHRWPGIVDIQIFTAREDTHLEIREHADRVMTIFEGQELFTASGYLVRTYNTNLSRVGETEGWMQHNAWTRFDYEAAF